MSSIYLVLCVGLMLVYAALLYAVGKCDYNRGKREGWIDGFISGAADELRILRASLEERLYIYSEKAVPPAVADSWEIEAVKTTLASVLLSLPDPPREEIAERMYQEAFPE